MPNPFQISRLVEDAVVTISTLGKSGDASEALLDSAIYGGRASTDLPSLLQAKGLITSLSATDLADVSKVLKLEPYPGADLTQTASDVTDLATRLGRQSSVRFNGIDLPVAPGDTPQSVIDAYDAAMNSPERLQAAREASAQYAALAEKEATSVRQAIEGLEGQPGRSEAVLISALKAEAGKGNWVIHGLESLRNPHEMQTMANYYARTYPAIAATNIKFGISKFVPGGAESAWRAVLGKIQTA